MKVAQDAPKRPALRYYGGKWKLAKWILGFFPPHMNYCEPCGGAASVLLQKPRSPLETYNDLDGNVVNFFRVLRDRPEELIRLIRLTPWARAEYELSLENCEDEVERARRFFVACWQGMTGVANPTRRPNPTWKVQKDVRDVYRLSCDLWRKEWRELLPVADRFDGVQIENKDALDIIERYSNSETLVYFDPPYLYDTRAPGSINEYTAEQGDDDFHTDAAHLLHQAQGYVVVSGYACPLYTELYEAHGWERHDKEAQTNSGGKRIESVWLSPRTVEALGRPRQMEMFK